MQQEQNKKLAQELGEQLKQVREAADLTLEAISQRTRINLPILKSIESGNCESWPEAAFIRGFIENICRECAASPLPILELLKQMQNAQTPASDSALMKKISTSRKSEAIKTYLLSFLTLKSVSWLVLGVFVVIGVSTYFSSQDKMSFPGEQTQLIEKKSKAVSNSKALENTQKLKSSDVGTIEGVAKNATPEAAAMKDAKDKNEDIEHDKDLKHIITLENSAKNPTTHSAPAFSQIDIKVKQAVKISQTCDGLPTQQMEYVPGTYSLKFNKICELLIDDASLVEVSFNKNPLGALASYKQKRRLQFRHNEQKL